MNKTTTKKVAKPPFGLIPKEFYYQQIRAERFSEVCSAIARYYNAGLKINIEWINEYNSFIEVEI